MVAFAAVVIGSGMYSREEVEVGVELVVGKVVEY